MKILLIFIVFFISVECWASKAEFEEGKHYKVIDRVLKEKEGKVVQYFSYVCQHCFRAEEGVKSLVQELPEDIIFERVPVHFGKKKYLASSYAWFVLLELGFKEELHQYIYNSLHVPVGREKDFNKLRYIEDVRTLFVKGLGFDEGEYENAYKNILRKRMVEIAHEESKTVKVAGTPTFLVNGKYLISGAGGGVYQGDYIKSLVLFLLRKE